MDRVYITGVKGMLGRAVVPIFRDRYEVFPADLGETDVRDADHIVMDICRAKPKFVLHLAAMTDVDSCETNADEAYSVNAIGTKNVALACQRCEAVMAYVSTGMVYDGRKETPYVESDPASPLNVYARSKYEGELMMKDVLSRYYTFYSCWLFGGGAADKKFVGRIIERARNSSELRVVNDKFGSPTYTVDLAKRIFDFIESGLYGKYHCANAGCVNRFEMSREILKAAGITGCRLVPVSSDEYLLPAARPRMEALRNYNFELLDLAPMRSWREALDDYIATSIA
jgi:dTDP-4-dehydrorhamnose reductase